MRVEALHSSKFLLRGQGLRHDFAHAGSARRRALLRGAAQNERALVAAMEEASAAGVPAKFLDEALRVANALAVAQAELASDYMRLEGKAPPASDS